LIGPGVSALIRELADRIRSSPALMAPVSLTDRPNKALI
jgi:hypothetical protein